MKNCTWNQVIKLDIKRRNEIVLHQLTRAQERHTDGMLFSVFTHSHLLAQKSGEEHLLFVHSEVLTDAVPAETPKQTVET